MSTFQVQRAKFKGYISLKVFVGNTYQKILDRIHNVSDIKYVPGKYDQLNESDLITKGRGMEDLGDNWFFSLQKHF